MPESAELRLGDVAIIGSRVEAPTLEADVAIFNVEGKRRGYLGHAGDE